MNYFTLQNNLNKMEKEANKFKKRGKNKTLKKIQYYIILINFSNF